MESSRKAARIRWRYVLPGLQVVVMMFVNLLGSSAVRVFFYLFSLPALLASVATVIAISEIAAINVPDEVMLWTTALFLLPLWYALGRWLDRLTGSLPPRPQATSEMGMVGDVAAILLVALMLYFSLGVTLNVSIGTRLPDLQMKNAITGWLAAFEVLLLFRLARRFRARRAAR